MNVTKFHPNAITTHVELSLERPGRSITTTRDTSIRIDVTKYVEDLLMSEVHEHDWMYNGTLLHMQNTHYARAAYLDIAAIIVDLGADSERADIDGSERVSGIRWFFAKPGPSLEGEDEVHKAYEVKVFGRQQTKDDIRAYFAPAATLQNQVRSLITLSILSIIMCLAFAVYQTLTLVPVPSFNPPRFCQSLTT
jgi:hypothetical protein